VHDRVDVPHPVPDEGSVRDRADRIRVLRIQKVDPDDLVAGRGEQPHE